MITSQTFAVVGAFCVLGLGRSGVATIKALRASGARTFHWDDSPTVRAAFDGDLLDEAQLDQICQQVPYLVAAPGVPHTSPLLVSFEAGCTPVIGDIELFAWARNGLPPHRVVGITGTNGKSTTTALIHHILVSAGRPAAMGGNIGVPVLALDPLPAGGIYVLELSSYQLDLTETLACDVAVLLNITPDHLDRHGTMENYVAAKTRLLQMQTSGATAIIGKQVHADFDILSRVGEPAITWWSDADNAAIGPPPADPVVTFIEDVDAGNQADWPALQGPHNLQNARAAVAACRALGLNDAEIAAGLASYPGLPHRMERVGAKAGVLFVNDSKATNPESAAPALAAFPRTHWIVGGKAKGADLDAVMPYLDNVVAAYLIGEAAPLFEPILAPRLPVVMAGTLDRAVAAAAAAAKPGETVLLSPACASFDQFRDFEARGDAFRELVGAL